jgi:hypothetical protein
LPTAIIRLAIAASPRVPRAGGLNTSGCNVSSGVKGLKYRANNLDADECGSTVVLVSNCGHLVLASAQFSLRC